MIRVNYCDSLIRKEKESYLSSFEIRDVLTIVIRKSPGLETRAACTGFLIQLSVDVQT